MIRTEQELIDVIGQQRVADLAGVEYRAVYNYVKRGLPLPARLEIFLECKRRRIKVDPALFRVNDPDLLRISASW